MPPEALLPLDARAISLALRTAIQAKLVSLRELSAYTPRYFDGGKNPVLANVVRGRVEETVAEVLTALGYESPEPAGWNFGELIDSYIPGYNQSSWSLPGFEEAVSDAALAIVNAPNPELAAQLSEEEVATVTPSQYLGPVPPGVSGPFNANGGSYGMTNDPLTQLQHEALPGGSIRAQIDAAVQSSPTPANTLMEAVKELHAIDPALAIAYLQTNPVVTEFDQELQTQLANNEADRIWFDYLVGQANASAARYGADATREGARLSATDGLLTDGDINSALANYRQQLNLTNASDGLFGMDGEGNYGFRNRLADFRTGQNYIDASNGLLANTGQVNPDMLFHNLANTTLASSGGMFDPDAIQADRALASVNNPFAFAAWRMGILPEIDERWQDFDTYYRGWRPPSWSRTFDDIGNIEFPLEPQTSSESEVEVTGDSVNVPAGFMMHNGALVPIDNVWNDDAVTNMYNSPFVATQSAPARTFDTLWNDDAVINMYGEGDTSGEGGAPIDDLFNTQSLTRQSQLGRGISPEGEIGEGWPSVVSGTPPRRGRTWDDIQYGLTGGRRF